MSYLAEQGMIMKTKLTQSRTVEPYPLVNKISDSNLSYFYKYIGWVGQSPVVKTEQLLQVFGVQSGG